MLEGSGSNAQLAAEMPHSRAHTTLPALLGGVPTAPPTTAPRVPHVGDPAPAARSSRASEKRATNEIGRTRRTVENAAVSLASPPSAAWIGRRLDGL